MAYDFDAMTARELRAALDAPTGDYFARRIASIALARLEETTKDADELDRMVKDQWEKNGFPEQEGDS